MDALRDRLERHPRLAAPVRAAYREVSGRLRRRSGRPVEDLLDRLAARLVEDPCLRVDEFDGEFELDARSALFRRLARDGDYEPWLGALFERHVDPSRDVLDVGANVGFHAVRFARLLGAGRRVVSVEPTRRAADRLDRNLARNGVADRVVVHRGAVADRAGTMELKTIAGREEFSTLGAMAHPAVDGERWEIETVSTCTLDELVERHGVEPGFVKVDVEGAEHLVFAGAARTLSVHRPVIVTELSDDLLRGNGSSAREIVELISGHGYRITDPQRPGVEPGSASFADVLCVPV